ncbi:DUF6265 family protein [Maribacter sp. PR1]|uniref:DUF6265 family protein n=1 Tax=Maribacter cobaltidurans TaxID=1178778 RepID=A0ABU7IQG9_9FLAO|nr:MULTISPECIES: DUF6265 family protein [Maribacter]MDC6387668.1 DUF6265 family protein [Maribacter sp. PR1]MEE1975056.1 DUF6265 family protein [Maribacter cobaltidurans]
MKLVIPLFFLVCLSITAQNTLSLEEGATSPKATLLDVEWMTGHWKGEAFGGITEEIWSPPLGGSMMFSFKLVVNGMVNFYELGHIKEVDGTLLLQLKHFDGDLKGWEEKNDTVDFKLVKLEPNKVFFDDFTLERISDQEINLFVVVGDNDGNQEEVQFNYKRQ